MEDIGTILNSTTTIFVLVSLGHEASIGFVDALMPDWRLFII